MCNVLKDVKYMCPKTWEKCNNNYDCRMFRLNFDKKVKELQNEDKQIKPFHLREILDEFKVAMKNNFFEKCDSFYFIKKNIKCDIMEKFIKCLDWVIENHIDIYKYQIKENEMSDISKLIQKKCVYFWERCNRNLNCSKFRFHINKFSKNPLIDDVKVFKSKNDNDLLNAYYNISIQNNISTSSPTSQPNSTSQPQSLTNDLNNTFSSLKINNERTNDFANCSEKSLLNEAKKN